MSELGKPLVFYLKYMAEMNLLYGDQEHYNGEDPDLTGLDDADEVRTMARLVGAAAYEHAADFLELCGERIEKHFTGLKIATVAQRRTRSYVVRNWDWSTRVYATSLHEGWFRCGVRVNAPPEVRISLAEDVCGIVVPQLWTKGGRTVADAVRSLLSGWVDSRMGEALYHEGSGTVELGCIPIKAHPPSSFDVDRDQLLSEVMKVIGRIGAKETKAIAKFVAALKEPEEG